MNEHLNNLISEELCHAAFRYIQKGIPEFYNLANGGSGDYQTPTGNLSIAIELMLKALIAKKKFHKVFIEIPHDQIETIEKGHDLGIVQRRKFENFDYKTISFDDSKGLVKSMYDDFTELGRLMKIVRKIRNRSVHSSLISLEKFYVYRIFYLIVGLADYCVSKGCTEHSVISQKERDYIAKIDNQKLAALSTKINLAKQKSDKIDYWTVSFGTDEKPNWDKLKGECSICRCEGEFYGETILQGTTVQTLIFKTEAFRCFQCELELSDKEELDLLHYALCIPRDEDLFAYLNEFGSNPVKKASL